MNLNEWAIEWGVPFAAVEDLRRRMGLHGTDPANGATGDSETGVSVRVRLEASRAGCRLWRNNVGACMDENGNFIRYGLANDSKKLNEEIKSSDQIGIRPVVIQPHHVGTVIGQFMAREVKRPGWTFSGTPRERAQLAFLELVVSLGGDGAFCTGEGSI